MSKLFSSILFSFFLLFHTTAIAEEEIASTQTDVEVQGEQESEVSEETEPTDANDEQESQEEVTEEALAAEEAELRELGMEEEPVAE